MPQGPLGGALGGGGPRRLLWTEGFAGFDSSVFSVILVKVTNAVDSVILLLLLYKGSRLRRSLYREHVKN